MHWKLTGTNGEISDASPERAVPIVTNREIGLPEKLYPPKNTDEITAAEINILMYSANKKNPSFIEPYSV